MSRRANATSDTGGQGTGTGTGTATGTGTGVGGSGGTGGDGTGGSATEQLTITVIDYDSDPIQGAGVAVDLADDSRIEVLTGADGVATIDVPVGVGISYVIGHKDGYSFNTFPGPVLGTSMAAELWLSAEGDAPTMVEVSGTASNMSDPLTDYLTVETSLGGFFEERGTDVYSLEVESGQPFTFMALNAGEFVINGQDLSRTFHSFVTMDHAAITQATIVDIDFGVAQPSTTPFTTSFALPADATLGTTGVGLINVIGAETFTGGSQACIVAGGAFDCTGLIWDLGQATALTVYVVIDPALVDSDYGPRTVAISQGGPSVGLVDMDLLNVPVRTAPTGAGPHALDTLIQYTIADGGGDYDVVVSNIATQDGRLLGFATPWEGEVYVPALPSTSNATAAYEDSMVVNLYTCRIGSGNSCGAYGLLNWEASPPAN